MFSLRHPYLRSLYRRQNRLVQRASRFSTSTRSCNEASHAQTTDYETKYAEKLQQRAQERGKTVTELRAQLREQEQEQRKKRLAARSPEQDSARSSAKVINSAAPTAEPSFRPSTLGAAVRKDSSPVKPLSHILNLDKLLQNPLTAEQVSALWTAYHASRSGGTGRGFLCATVPVATYEKMMDTAIRYPSFVLPVPRDNAQTGEPIMDDKRPCEFYFMEWGFHGPPPEPTSSRDLFSRSIPSNNPVTSTILFTPLQEYKHRTSFATPYLVVTHYTDLARSHGVVLLRGEITPSAASTTAAGGEGTYMLTQQDAQLLAVSVQKFYLWGDGQNEREALLRGFHERPGEFKWEDLLKHADFSG